MNDIVILKFENGKYEVVGLGHCSKNQNALYGVTNNLEDAKRIKNKRENFDQ